MKLETDKNVELLNLIRSTENVIKRSKGNSSVPKGNGRIMHAIYENDGMPQAKLAEKVGIRPQSLTRTLADLEQNGYIRRQRSEKDSRAVVVYITDDGREYYKKIRASREQRAEKLFSCLSEEEKDILADLLQRVIAGYGEEDNAIC